MTPERELALRARLRKLGHLQSAVANEIQAIRIELAVKPRPTSKGPRIRRPKNARPPCGTDSGYQWHRYHDPENWPLPAEDPCGCKAAHSLRLRLREAERRAQKREKEVA